MESWEQSFEALKPRFENSMLKNEDIKHEQEYDQEMCSEPVIKPVCAAPLNCMFYTL